MFSVSEQSETESGNSARKRKILVFAIAAAVLCGPVFFAFALMMALYGPVTVDVSDTAVASDRIYLAHQIDEQTMPVPTDGLASGLRQQHTAVSKTRASAEEKNPLKAYLAIRGAARSLQLSLAEHDVTGSKAPQSQRTFRAVCVRLCDGYYFPIATSTTPDQFSRLSSQCESRCGSPARLYVYPIDGGSPAEMRDLEGNAYLTLANAFRHHTGYSPQCTCRAQPWTDAAKDRHRQYAANEAAAPRVKLVSITKNPEAETKSVSEASRVAVREIAVAASGSVSAVTPTVVATSASPERVIARLAKLQGEPSMTAGLPSERLTAVNERSTLLASFNIAESLAAVKRRNSIKRASREPIDDDNPAPYEFASAEDVLAVIAVEDASPVKKSPKKPINTASALVRSAYDDSSADEILRRNLTPFY
ncbi:MAG: DUF2865 domain-containing protein [Filomicrobium sp.]